MTSSARSKQGTSLCCGQAFEAAARQAGARLVAGIDEVGRGALAGPVVAAAVILDLERVPAGIDDSKKLTRSERERLEREIRASALSFAIARVEAEEIDRINILQATKKAMRGALGALDPKPDYLLIDAVTLEELEIPQQAIIRGDEQSVSIAAASIIAKVARDAWMRACDELWPGYGFASHVGYATQTHLRRLRELGPAPIHRLSFRGVLPASDLFDLR